MKQTIFSAAVNFLHMPERKMSHNGRVAKPDLRALFCSVAQSPAGLKRKQRANGSGRGQTPFAVKQTSPGWTARQSLHSCLNIFTLFEFPSLPAPTLPSLVSLQTMRPGRTESSKVSGGKERRKKNRDRGAARGAGTF